jgi:uncharacterized membrane protein YedE/YeeE
MDLALTPPTAVLAVVWGGLAIGCVLGAAVQASRFCTMGALTDWFIYGGRARLLMWALAVVVAATGATALIGIHAFDPSRALAWSPRLPWLSHLVGGLAMGFGMVLASGCPQRNLVRVGEGSLKSLVTLIVAAIAAQMSLRGLFAGPRVQWLDAAAIELPFGQDLGSILAAGGGGTPMAWRWGLIALGAAVLVALLRRDRAAMDPGQHLGGVLVGLMTAAAWALTGTVGFVAEHPETLEPAWLGTYSHRPEALSFAAPLAHTLDLLTLWSDRSTTASFGVMVCIGVVLGSAVSALLRREFRIESFRDADDLGRHLVGGGLIGFGGVTALGCTIGQGVSGLSLLSAGAVLTVAGIVAGCALALRWQSRRLDAD